MVERLVGNEEAVYTDAVQGRREEVEDTEQAILPVKGEVILGMSAGP